MVHFADQTWADFVRGTGPTGSMREIDAHLATGCPDCAVALDFWRQLGTFGTNEREYAPPRDLVRVVKLSFPGPEARQPEMSMLARLIYDSTLRPLPVGIRSGAASTRQVVYEADGLTVDLRFERKPHSRTISASGQVLDKQAPLTWLGNAAIVLWTDKGRIVTATEANEFGEFQFEFAVQDQLRISIAAAGRKTLRIPLGILSE